MKLRNILLSLPVMALTLLSTAHAQNDAQATDKLSANPIIGEVEGQPVYLDDIMNKEIFEQYSKALNSIESAFRIHALEKLAKTQEDIKSLDEFQVSEDEVQAFYQAQKLESRGTIEQFRGQIIDVLGSQKFFAQYTNAQQNSLAESFIEIPEQPKVSVTVDERAIRGANEAEVMILEFSDYQCPFCSRVQPTVKNLMEQYGEQVSFAYKHMPLPFHKEADEAANAAECAKDQGKFEEMHALLFTKPKNQFMDDLKQYGRDVGIEDLAQYDQCLEEGKYNSLVKANMDRARSIGVNGTPGFLIGKYNAQTSELEGVVISGAVPKQNFEQIIDQFLN